MAPVKKGNPEKSRRRKSKRSSSRDSCKDGKCSLGRRSRAQRREKRQLRTAGKFGAKKPKRAFTGYILFVKKFHRDQKKQNEEMTGIEIIRGAAKAWKKLPAEEKDDWNRRAGKGRTSYQERMAQFKNERQLLKRAPQSYGLFVHSFWEDNRQEGIGFVEMSKNCAQEWRTLSDSEKGTYQKRSAELKEGHAKMIAALKNGGRIEDFLPSPSEATPTQ